MLQYIVELFQFQKDTKQILENIKKIEAQIIELKTKLKKETNFNEKVSFNMELKKVK